VPPTGNQGLTTAQASGDLESALVDALRARRAHEANATALEQNHAIQRGAVTLGT
jgi:flagellar basal body rod protein FlgC